MRFQWLSTLPRDWYAHSNVHSLTYSNMLTQIRALNGQGRDLEQAIYEFFTIKQVRPEEPATPLKHLPEEGFHGGELVKYQPVELLWLDMYVEVVAKAAIVMANGHGPTHILLKVMSNES